MNQNNKHISKFLSYVLRHKPEEIDLTLDQNGWADLNELLAKMAGEFKGINIETIVEVVESNDKQRFALNEDQTKIRANQGHSIEVDVELEQAVPPSVLYHGTVAKFIASIKQDGLQKRNRQHVHLSATVDTAIIVGTRRGEAIILEIAAYQMHTDGFQFFLSKNGVWLTDQIPSKYINY